MIAKRNYVVGMVMVAVVAFSGASQADEQFSLRSLRGTWGFSVSGTLATVPAAAVGLVTFDGEGDVSNRLG